MAAKASELYVLFQNKAYHYQNLHEMRSKVEDHLSSSINNSINSVVKQKYDRDFPKNKRYQVQAQNKGIANRIHSISQTDRREIVADGSYARFNRFQRSFRTINHYKNEEERQIQIQNEKIKQKINRMKSSSTKYWHSEYKDIAKFVKKEVNEELNSSRTSLHIEKKPFLAQPYLQLLNHLNKESHLKKEKKTLDSSSLQKKAKDEQKVKIELQNIFVLPQFHNKEQKLNRSKASSKSGRASATIK